MIPHALLASLVRRIYGLQNFRLRNSSPCSGHHHLLRIVKKPNNKIEKPGNPSTNHPRGRVFEQHRHVGSITDNTADAESKIKKFRLLKHDKSHLAFLFTGDIYHLNQLLEQGKILLNIAIDLQSCLNFQFDHKREVKKKCSELQTA